MTPFQVYLLLQMDSLNTALGILLVLSGLVSAFLLLFAAVDGWQYFKGKIFLKYALLVLMIVLPKLTSPAALDAMGKEGQQLYALAKKALENLADDKKKEE